VKVDETPHLQAQAFLLSLLEIIDRLWDVDADLERWYKELENNTPGPLYQTKFSTMDSPADDTERGKLFPIAFHFSSLLMAHTVVMYWAGQVMVWRELTWAYQSVSLALDQCTVEKLTIPYPDNWSAGMVCTCNDAEHITCVKHFDPAQLPPLEHRADWPHSAAKNIFQSVEFCLQDEMMGLGPNTVAPALMLTIYRLFNTPGDWKRELSWAEAVLGKVHGKGFSLYKYFHNQ